VRFPQEIPRKETPRILIITQTVGMLLPFHVLADSNTKAMYWTVFHDFHLPEVSSCIHQSANQTKENRKIKNSSVLSLLPAVNFVAIIGRIV
jgi:hypothetical protein